MKKAVLFFTILLCLSIKMDVYAGNLNANESAVVSAARGEFEVNGEKYRLASGYISELIGYLSGDGVDLTAEQKNQAISEMYASIQQGVAQGYLVKTGSDKTASEHTNGKAGELVKDVIGKNEKSQTEEKQTEEKQTVKTKIDTDNGKVVVIDKEENRVLTVDMAIKDTGFHLDKTVLVGATMIIIMIACIIVTFKYKFFAKINE